jgi:hypothetical protein
MKQTQVTAETKSEKFAPQLTASTRERAFSVARDGLKGEVAAVDVLALAVQEVRKTPGYQAERAKHAENFRASGIAAGLILSAVLPAYPADADGEVRAREFVSRIRRLWLSSVGYKAPKRAKPEIELEVGAALAVQALISNFTGRKGIVSKDTLRPMLAILRGLSEGRLSLGDIAKACQYAGDAGDAEQTPAAEEVQAPAAEEVQAPAADMVPVAM